MFTLLNTISLKEALALKTELNETIKSLRESAKAQKRVVQEVKAEQRIEKAAAAGFKLQERIEKAQLRLQKLQEKKAKPVGTKAIKAERKPSKVKFLLTGLRTEAQEANAISAHWRDLQNCNRD